MKKLASIIVLLSFAVASQAQILWKVSDNGAKGDNYILGTHHIAPVAILDSLEDFGKALDNADVVIGEIDMSIMSDPTSLQQKMMGHIVAPADSTMSKLLSAEQADSVNTVLSAYTNGMATLAQLDAYKPSFVGQQLGMLINMKAFPDFNMTEQLDATIQTRGHNAGKPVEGFETFDFQCGMLYDAPIAEQITDLLKSVRDTEKAVSQAQQLADAYLAGDLDKTAKLFDDEDMSPAQRARLIDNRNDAWVKEFAKRAPEQKMLIAVGFGHLVGEKGLLQQLRNLGYTVTPAK